MSLAHFKINGKFGATTDREDGDDSSHVSSLWIVSIAEAEEAAPNTTIVRAVWEHKKSSKRGDKKFFMKSWNQDVEYGSMMQELEILRAGRNNCNCIVELVASHVSPKNIHIILELASGTMQSRYFSSGELVLNHRIVGADAHRKFLEECCAPFFKNALHFLHRVVCRVYCDWKFDNILCFDTADGSFPQLKLADFSSAQQIDKSIENPKNCNQAFTPASLCSELKTICPCIEDDYASVRYLFAKLNGLQLSWEQVGATIPSSGMTSFHYIVIALLKTRLFNPIDTSKCIYWPSFLETKVK